MFRLVDAWRESSNQRQVFKVRLELVATSESIVGAASPELEHIRLIPSSVKLEVWKRDNGKRVRCGRTNNLHFDHIIPFSKGGTSFAASNIQILCARHNLAEHDTLD